MPNRSAISKAAQPSTAVNFDMPAGACDCHTHIHADPEKIPFYAGRVYTPEPASPEEMSALHKALHIERVVIVTPSVYGPDNSATLFGIKAFAVAILGGIGNAWGVVLAGLIYGVAEALIIALAGSTYSQIATFALVILALAIRPTGLFGHAEVKKV